jgi:predicted transcriptional regulator
VKKKGTEHEDLTGNVAVRDLIEQEKQEELDKVMATAHDTHTHDPTAPAPIPSR